jgi:hypothetical protein
MFELPGYGSDFMIIDGDDVNIQFFLSSSRSAVSPFAPSSIAEQEENLSFIRRRDVWSAYAKSLSLFFFTLPIPPRRSRLLDPQSPPQDIAVQDLV